MTTKPARNYNVVCLRIPRNKSVDPGINQVASGMGVVLRILTKPILNWTKSVNAVQGKGLITEIWGHVWFF